MNCKSESCRQLTQVISDLKQRFNTCPISYSKNDYQRLMNFLDAQTSYFCEAISINKRDIAILKAGLEGVIQDIDLLKKILNQIDIVTNYWRIIEGVVYSGKAQLNTNPMYNKCEDLFDCFTDVDNNNTSTGCTNCGNTKRRTNCSNCETTWIQPNPTPICPNELPDLCDMTFTPGMYIATEPGVYSYFDSNPLYSSTTYMETTLFELSTNIVMFVPTFDCNANFLGYKKELLPSITIIPPDDCQVYGLKVCDDTIEWVPIGPSVTYNSARYCKDFRKNDCEEGFMGTIVNVCSEAGRFTSTVSQAAADQLAVDYVNANGQQIANNQGDCIPARQCPEGFDAGGQTAYQTTRIILGSQGGKVRFLLGTYEQADSFAIHYGDEISQSTLLWSTKSLPTANPTTGLVSTAAIRANNYNNGLYKQYAICDNEVIAGNNQLAMYEIAVEFDYNPTDTFIDFVTLVTQAPEPGTRWSYKMGCPCPANTPTGDWNYCQDCSQGEIFYNDEICRNFTRNNCPSGQHGSTVNICVEAGTYQSLISKSDANAQANAWLNTSGQTAANQQGTCIDDIVFYSARYCKNFQKNNCQSGTGSIVEFCAEANHSTSTISQIDANNKAIAYVNANGQAHANSTGDCTEDPIYWNVRYCASFDKNDCPSGFGSTVEFCAEADTISSEISQADADQQAIDYVNANGQDYANQHGECTPTELFYNERLCQIFTRNNCSVGYTPGTYNYCVEANSYSSEISQADANSKAQNDINTNGQSAANSNATCTPQNTNPIWTPTGLTNCSTSADSNVGSGGIYYFYQVKDTNPNSASYNTLQWRRDATKDGLCDTTNRNPIWNVTSTVCSCNADSITGNNDGSYYFEIQTQSNPNCLDPPYLSTRQVRQPSADYICPINEGTWQDTEETICEGTSLYKLQRLYRCGVQTSETRKGSLIENNSVQCGAVFPPDWRPTGNVRCQTVGGQNTGYREIEEKDFEPTSPSYNQTRWVTGAYNIGLCPLPTYCADTQSATRTRNNCPANSHPDLTCSRTVTLYADDGEFCGYNSKNEANIAASNAAVARAQAQANADCACIQDSFCNTVAYTRTAYKNNCPSGSSADGACSASSTVPIGAECGHSSAALANAAAEARAQAQAQAQANAISSGCCTWYNDRLCQTFTKNNCNYGHGNSLDYCVASGTYNSQISKADANSKAQVDINANGQNWVNEHTGCCILLANTNDSSYTFNCDGTIVGNTIRVISTNNDIKIVPTIVSKPSWVNFTISDSGQYYLFTTSMTPNNTGVNRTGVLSITNGCDTISVTLTQVYCEYINLTLNLDGITSTQATTEVFVFMNGEEIFNNTFGADAGIEIEDLILKGSHVKVVATSQAGSFPDGSTSRIQYNTIGTNTAWVSNPAGGYAGTQGYWVWNHCEIILETGNMQDYANITIFSRNFSNQPNPCEAGQNPGDPFDCPGCVGQGC